MLHKKLSFIKEPAANPHEGPVYRNTRSKEGLVTSPIDGITTLYEVFEYATRTFADQKLMAYRTVLDIIEEDKWVTKTVAGKQEKQKKTWRYFKLSEYHWYTGKEVRAIIGEIGSGLRKLGVTKEENVSIYAPTSAEWQLFAQGCFHQGIAITTAYDTLGDEGLCHALNQCEVSYIFIKSELFANLARVAPNTEKLSHAIYFGDLTEEAQNHIKTIRETKPGFKVHSFEELREIGRQNPSDPSPPLPSDMACIMYTSGSTGAPKGVKLTHANMVATLGGAYRVLKPFAEPGDCLLSYLPLAHVLQLMVECVLYSLGVQIGYGTPRTLTNQSVRDCLGDMCEFKPTLLVGVPQVWDTIRKGVLSTVNNSSPLVRNIFHIAYYAKLWLKKYGLPTGLLDRIVFKKIQAQTGGRLRMALSGGAGISQDSQEFLSTTLCPIIQGYGMTETSGIIALMDPSCLSLRKVGPPLPSVEVKLVDVPDTEYKASEGRGEIWARGAGITSGYYKQDDLTKEVLTEDGWFQTGDIGEWQSDGQLMLIDRKKNLVKLAHGEYIALEKLESVYKTALLVGNICVYADGEQTRPVALVVPDPKGLLRYAENNGLLQKLNTTDHEHDLEHLAQLPEVHAAVLKSCAEAARQNSLSAIEQLQDIYVVPGEWNSENSMLTPAQKLNRNVVVKEYMPQINKMYGK
ncbi:long-chain fatty acid-CoA ligase [Dimargaris cristalligena]|uniref:AMP-dependent synthetase/ligase domain-containing protein n=1 Tax=Dimargaris cristalligena TaxID=215637 RepID=A0A4P9ZN81_9FUNG|nr:long-chain fatty acid-CoA ligase [Dimargaris cristalligena]RKP34615.1 hypothetical protein BJ085DRAFT_34862 [Dimargaris cristalligena]|eukprot:RKP34615.1 hypothetical protein BJ085DRAFT_34862 [Dimargaris cristalligena]